VWSSHAVSHTPCGGPGLTWLRNDEAFSLRGMAAMKWLKLVAWIAAMHVGSPAFAICTVSATGVAFGVYQSPMQTSDVLSSGTLTMTCDKAYQNKPYKASYTSLYGYLDSGKDKLNYLLYADSARTVLLTNGYVYQGTTSESQVLTIYGRIGANQNVSPGSYSDTLTVQVTY